MMAIAAEFIAWHLVDTGPAEGRTDLRDETWHDHRVHVGGGKQKAVNHIGAGDAEFHRRIDRNLRALRHEGILFTDHPDRDGAVGLSGGAGVAFGKLAAAVQGAGIALLHLLPPRPPPPVPSPPPFSPP